MQKETHLAAQVDDLLNGAIVHHQQGRLADAEAMYRTVLSQAPLHSWALHLLGLAVAAQGRTEAGRTHLRAALALEPAAPSYYNNTGEALYAVDRASSEAYYRRAVSIDPRQPHAYGNLVARFGDLLPSSLVLRLARRHVVLDPGSGPAVANYGSALDRVAEASRAHMAFRRAMVLMPGSAEIRLSLGQNLVRLGRRSEARQVFAGAVALNPQFAAAHHNLGRVLYELGSTDPSISALHKSLALDPRESEIHNSLGNISIAVGDASAAVCCFRRALVEGSSPSRLGNVVMALLYSDTADAAAIFDAARAHADAFPAPTVRSTARRRDDKRRLRVGYLSADLFAHPVGESLLAVFHGTDPASTEIYAYANVERQDTFSARLEGYTSGWRSVFGMTDDETTELIRDDRIDVLIGVANQTKGGRLGVFARRAAPVQAALFDLTTTGLDAMDYWIGDDLATPPDTEERFSETVLRLPCWCAFSVPPEDVPAPARTGAGDATVTFGSFNNPGKLSPSTIETWARILRATPGSRLVLKHVEHYGSRAIQSRLSDLFASHGISPDRLVYASGRSSKSEHFGLYHDVDVALDPFPYNGCNATFEALWMGVPVVALAGRRFLARMGAGFLPQVGLKHLVASSPDEYVDIAVRLAMNAAELDRLRRTLRQTVAASLLCNSAAYAASLNDACRRAWSQSTSA